MKSGLYPQGAKLLDLALVQKADRVLAEYGAEVIKVETGKGDNYRRFGEVFGVPAEADENIVFETVNSGKKFV